MNDWWHILIASRYFSSCGEEQQQAPFARDRFEPLQSPLYEGSSDTLSCDCGLSCILGSVEYRNLGAVETDCVRMIARINRSSMSIKRSGISLYPRCCIFIWPKSSPCAELDSYHCVSDDGRSPMMEKRAMLCDKGLTATFQRNQVPDTI